MSDKPRFVVDTNVLVSALLLADSTPGRAFRRVLVAGEVLLSAGLLAEIQEILARKKFERYVTAEDREDFLQALVDRGILVEPTEPIRVCRDPDDDRLLELAVAGRAHAIISGDQDLRSLNPFRGIPIISPAEFLRGEGSG